MRKLIENYRGWEIYFDTEKENFYTVSNEYDEEESKRSYASTKKYIDEYIKDNSNFKPVMVETAPSLYNSREVLRLIGIRKDGAFMCEDKNGNKKQLSKYSEKDYFLVNPDNEKHFTKIQNLQAEVELLRKKVTEEGAKIVKVGLEEIRNKYI